MNSTKKYVKFLSSGYFFSSYISPLVSNYCSFPLGHFELLHLYSSSEIRKSIMAKTTCTWNVELTTAQTKIKFGKLHTRVAQ